MSNSRLQQGFISAIILIAIFIGYGLLRYPLIIEEAGMASILVPVFMLLIYGVAAVWATVIDLVKHAAARLELELRLV